MSQMITLLLFLLFLANPVFSQLDDLYFPGFNHVTSNMSLNGAAVIEKNGMLRWKSGSILDVVDPRLNGEFNEHEAVLVLKLGLMCSNNAPDARPPMREVARCLEGEVALPAVVAAPNACDGKDVNANKVRSELVDHKHSYPNLEKVSTWSFDADYGDTDIEAGSDSALPSSGGS
ncbi:hypothetical protein D5086_020632 [Populus alba]|uniref:Uncharacterized protein n=1 Tax=Populus alba TaxID=43335 RepID=A0ACC4BKK6_POPAL